MPLPRQHNSTASSDSNNGVPTVALSRVLAVDPSNAKAIATLANCQQGQVASFPLCGALACLLPVLIC